MPGWTIASFILQICHLLGCIKILRYSLEFILHFAPCVGELMMLFSFLKPHSSEYIVWSGGLFLSLSIINYIWRRYWYTYFDIHSTRIANWAVRSYSVSHLLWHGRLSPIISHICICCPRFNNSKLFTRSVAVRDSNPEFPYINCDWVYEII